MKTSVEKDERIEIRISKRDKSLFQRAQKMSGDKSFGAFITRLVRAQAEEIIAEKERIIASKRDRKVFFDAVFATASQPNKALTAAVKKFKTQTMSK